MGGTAKLRPRKLGAEFFYFYILNRLNRLNINSLLNHLKIKGCTSKERGKK